MGRRYRMGSSILLAGSRSLPPLHLFRPALRHEQAGGDLKPSLCPRPARRKLRAMPDFALELAAGGRVAGVEEAGRGPLAGPVLAAAVVFLAGVPAGLARLLDDSKRLRPAAREEAFAALRAATAA